MDNKDTYNTIIVQSPEALFKDRGSKFYGYAFPVSNEDDIKEHLTALKKQHYNARHWCYAWQLGKDYSKHRFNDDGEPSNSAGAPIYGQIQSFNLTNVLVVVVRYFGGTKLGVGGLIKAYRTGAQLALEQSKIIEKTIDIEYVLKFNYPELNTVMRIIKEEQLTILSQKMEISCKIIIAVRKKEAKRIFTIFDTTFKVAIKEN